MKNGFTLSEILPVKASEIYEAWLSSEGHTAMTGSPALVDAKVGGAFSAWDGYIFGSILDLRPDQQIVQSWRTSEFPDDAPDSRLEVLLDEANDGTKVTIIHTDMPDGQVDSYCQGWADFYFKPMKKFFANRLV
jgi:activator of HSP90 ATPase